MTESDASYNLVVMGLWTLAEVATGVIVSCLPVLPRFFRDTGPKVRRAFSVGAKLSSSLDSASARLKRGTPVAAPTLPGSMPRSLEDFDIHNAHVKSDSTELDTYNVMVPEAANAEHHMRLGPIRANRDVESGGYGFPMRDTFYDETRLDASF